MKIKYRAQLLLATGSYQNLTLDYGAEIDTQFEADVEDLKALAERQGVSCRNTQELSETLKNFVEDELMAAKQAIELRPASDFKLKS